MCVNAREADFESFEANPNKSGMATPRTIETVRSGFCQETNGNDPSAGSPTETLLRLLLPLNDQV